MIKEKYYTERQDESLFLVVGRHNYMPNPTGKVAAHWQAVVEELESQDLIRYESSKSYNLTKSGFDLATEIGNKK